jgi:hypothetical protein
VVLQGTSHIHRWISVIEMECLSTHFVMSPTQQDVVQSTVWPVDPVLGRVHGVLQVWIVLERLRVNDLVRELAADDESVANDVPLALGSKEEQEFSQVVNEPCDLHPFGLSVPSDGLRSLQQVLDLRNGRLKSAGVCEIRVPIQTGVVLSKGGNGEIKTLGNIDRE